MRSLAIITLLVAVCSAQRFLEEKLQAQGTQDFATGFFLAMRAAEFCPHAFECASTAANVQAAVTEVQAALHDLKNILHVVDAVVKLTEAFKAAAPGCQSVASEGAAYVAEIKGIVTDKFFVLHAGQHLFQYRDLVGQDIKDYKQSMAEEQQLVAGMKLGEIGRITIWGTPAE